MTEQHIQRPNLGERLRNGVQNGWTRLMSTRAVFAENLSAGASLVSDGVQAVSKGVVSGVAEAYSEKSDANIFQRVGNVFREGWGNLSDHFEELREKAQKRSAEIKKRYEGLGVVGGVMARVDAAARAVQELPISVNTALMTFELLKVNKLQEKKSRIEGNVEPSVRQKVEVIDRTIGILHQRANAYGEKALAQRERLENLRSRLAELVTGNNPVVGAVEVQEEIE